MVSIYIWHLELGVLDGNFVKPWAVLQNDDDACQGSVVGPGVIQQPDSRSAYLRAVRARGGSEACMSEFLSFSFFSAVSPPHLVGSMCRSRPLTADCPGPT